MKITFEWTFFKRSTRTTFYHSVQTIFYTHCLFFSTILTCFFQPSFICWVFSNNFFCGWFFNCHPINKKLFRFQLSVLFFFTAFSLCYNWEKKFPLACFVSSPPFFYLILSVLATAFPLEKNSVFVIIFTEAISLTIMLFSLIRFFLHGIGSEKVDLGSFNSFLSFLLSSLCLNHLYCIQLYNLNILFYRYLFLNWIGTTRSCFHSFEKHFFLKITNLSLRSMFWGS